MKLPRVVLIGLVYWIGLPNWGLIVAIVVVLVFNSGSHVYWTSSRDKNKKRTGAKQKRHTQKKHEKEKNT